GLLTAGLQGISTQAQSGDQKAGPPGFIRVRVGLVPVDVIVTDDHDRPVTDLKQEDFQIFENGRSQEIRHFSVQTFTAAAAEPGQPSAIRLVPALELAPQQARTFLILLGRGRHNQGLKAIDALIQFVRKDLLPQDRVAVYAYGHATDFTTDHEQIAQVLLQYIKVYESIESWLELHLRGFNAFYGAKELPKSLQPEIAKIFETATGLASRQVPPGRVTAEGAIVREWDKAAGIILGSSDRAAETDMRAATANDAAASGLQTGSLTMQNLMAFDQLEADAITLSLPFDEFIPRAAEAIEDSQNIFTCIEYLRYMEGEKHLLFFSGKGLLFPYGDTEYDKGIAAVANDARVAIDTFHTGGLAPTIMPTTGVEVSSSRGATPASAPPPLGSLFSFGDTAAGQSLRNISAITGGHVSIYQDIGKALDIVNQSTRVEYLLGYYPKDENWNGKYRQINVRVNRPGLKLFFRRGYFARDKLQPYDRAEFLAYSRVSAAVMYADNVDDIPFKLGTSKGNDESGKPELQVDLKINAAKIALKTVNSLHTGKLRIAVYCQDAGGHPLGSISKTLDLKLQEASYQEYLKSGIPCSILIPTNAKDLFIKAVVYDMVGDKVGSRHMRVEKFWTP
ncbi:MAG: VWA domain-containing protein, partial [Acidobacteriota bacterium]